MQGLGLACFVANFSAVSTLVDAAEGLSAICAFIEYWVAVNNQNSSLVKRRCTGDKWQETFHL